MRRLALSLSFAVVIFTTAWGQQADDIIGKYHLPNKLDVEIYKQGNQYLGKIIGLNGFAGGQTNDVNNPDELKRADTLFGLVIIKNLTYDQNKKQWTGGNMYSPEKGMVFNLKVTEIRDREIEVVGSKFFLWRTLKWRRI